MADTIDDTIMVPDAIRELVGKEGGVGATGWVILEISGSGISHTYPSIKNGKELSPMSDEDYWEYKVKTPHNTVRLLVSGNAVCVEDFVMGKTRYKASAINSNTVDIYLN